MSTSAVFRIHPAINFARLGTSEDFYLSPDTAAGMPVDGGPTVGGLPIRRGTERETITSADLRDADGKLRRQAARFRIFAYPFDGSETYPNGGGEEVRVGSVVGGRTVADVVWTVHLANKKANAHMVVVPLGVKAFGPGYQLQVRNPSVIGAQTPPNVAGTPDDPHRVHALVIDPGPRAVRGRDAGPVRFDTTTTPSYGQGTAIAPLPDYPVTFPGLVPPGTPPPRLFEPSGPIETLGELRTDEHGRLLVLGGYGRAVGQFDEYNVPVQFTADVNNYSWFDDAADGPVSATLLFDDGSAAQVHGAWVVCADPAYAPQLRNVVSLWDDIYDSFVRNLALQPEICDGSGFRPDYAPTFEDQVRPVFRAAAMTRWGANLPEIAVRAHEAVDRIGPGDDPDRTVLAGLAYVRDPNQADELSVGVPLMPLSLGDSGSAFLAVSRTQYFFLKQWSTHRARPGAAPRGPGERLAAAALANCLGGRFVPGIEMTYIVREPDLYEMDWATSGGGPFRIKHAPLDYAAASRGAPFLTGGWIPVRSGNIGLEPGDTSKFMAIPWQTDYNSCSVHMSSINSSGRNTSFGNPSTLFWSWPAQRPVAVYVAADAIDGRLPAQKYSIRGTGTFTSNLKTMASFQDPVTAVRLWDELGIVLQGTAIEGGHDPAHFLEVASRLDPAPVVEWPFNAGTPGPPAR
jgi:hypothetical protein